MAYRRLRPYSATAAADATGRNPGNYTATIDTSQITSIQQFECYKIRLDGPIGFGVRVDINNNPWDETAQGWANAWDPNEPMILNAGDTINFYFAAPAGLLPAPVLTAWFRFDESLPGNPGPGLT